METIVVIDATAYAQEYLIHTGFRCINFHYDTSTVHTHTILDLNICLHQDQPYDFLCEEKFMNGENDPRDVTEDKSDDNPREHQG